MTKKKEWISIHLFQIGIERNNFIHKIIRYFLNPNFVTLKIQKVSHRKKETNFTRKFILASTFLKHMPNV